MRLVLQTEGIEVDDWLHDFLRTTVSFAVWHREIGIDEVEMRVDRQVDCENRTYIRCALRVSSPLGEFTAGATGGDVCAAACEAADLIESSFHLATRGGRPTSSLQVAA